MVKKTIIDLFESSVEKFGDKPFLLEKRAAEFEPTTYSEAREIALTTGAGLAALGITPKQTVSILAEGCNAWITSELGLLYAGAISVPLSIKLEESNDLLFRLRHADVSAIFVSRNQLPKIRRIREELPLLKHIIVWGDVELEEGEMSLAELNAMGKVLLAHSIQLGKAHFALLELDIAPNDDMLQQW